MKMWIFGFVVQKTKFVGRGGGGWVKNIPGRGALFMKKVF